MQYNEYHYVQCIYTKLAKQITYKSNYELTRNYQLKHVSSIEQTTSERTKTAEDFL